MEANPRARLDGHWLCLAMLCLCMELAQLTQGGQQEGKSCCSSTLAGIPVDKCGKCPRGKCCKDKSCRHCWAVPTCPEGQELTCSGTIDFKYFCTPCPNGTFSDTKGSCCRPWVNCKTLERPVRRPGNATHNTECGDMRPVIIMQTDSTVMTILTTVTATGLSLLILLTFFLIICIWTQKKKLPLVEEPESAVPSNFLGPHHEDTCSCQFPEEGHGDKTPEEKVSLNSLAHGNNLGAEP